VFPRDYRKFDHQFYAVAAIGDLGLGDVKAKAEASVAQQSYPRAIVFFLDKGQCVPKLGQTVLLALLPFWNERKFLDKLISKKGICGER
jgi:hypothetical protein